MAGRHAKTPHREAYRSNKTKEISLLLHKKEVEDKRPSSSAVVGWGMW